MTQEMVVTACTPTTVHGGL